jgi:hypothetical protein
VDRAKGELERQLENKRLMLKSQQREWESERLRLEEQVADLLRQVSAASAAAAMDAQDSVPSIPPDDVRLSEHRLPPSSMSCSLWLPAVRANEAVSG